MTLPPLPYAASPIKAKRKQYGRDRPTAAAYQGLKEAILQAAEDVGQDGEGKDGLVGYLRLVATTDVKAFCSLLGRVLPLTLAGEGKDGAITVEIVRMAASGAVEAK